MTLLYPVSIARYTRECGLPVPLDGPAFSLLLFASSISAGSEDGGIVLSCQVRTPLLVVRSEELILFYPGFRNHWRRP